jgi:hypothetical protein
MQCVGHCSEGKTDQALDPSKLTRTATERRRGKPRPLCDTSAGMVGAVSEVRTARRANVPSPSAGVIQATWAACIMVRYIYITMKGPHRITWLPYAGLKCGGLGQLQQCPSATLSTSVTKILLPKSRSYADDCQAHLCSSDVVHPDVAASKEALLPITACYRASLAP